jgi:hypothetical protein
MIYNSMIVLARASRAQLLCLLATAFYVYVLAAAPSNAHISEAFE